MRVRGCGFLPGPRGTSHEKVRLRARRSSRGGRNKASLCTAGFPAKVFLRFCGRALRRWCLGNLGLRFGPVECLRGALWSAGRDETIGGTPCPLKARPGGSFAFPPGRDAHLTASVPPGPFERYCRSRCNPGFVWQYGGLDVMVTTHHRNSNAGVGAGSRSGIERRTGPPGLMMLATTNNRTKGRI